MVAQKRPPPVLNTQTHMQRYTILKSPHTPRPLCHRCIPITRGSEDLIQSLRTSVTSLTFLPFSLVFFLCFTFAKSCGCGC